MGNEDDYITKLKMYHENPMGTIFDPSFVDISPLCILESLGILVRPIEEPPKSNVIPFPTNRSLK